MHSCFMLRELKDPELVLTDHIIIHYLEMEKFLKKAGFSNSLEKWMAYFKYEGKDEEIMQIIIKDDPLLEKAHQNYTQFTRNDELIELYEGRMKWQLDYNSGILAAKEQGIEEGIQQGVQQGVQQGLQQGLQQGIQQEKRDVAGKMLADGLAVDLVARYTGLSVQAVEEIKAHLSGE